MLLLFNYVPNVANTTAAATSATSVNATAYANAIAATVTTTTVTTTVLFSFQVQGLKEEVRRMDTKNDAVDARINALSDELNGKFDLLLRALNVNPTNGTPISSPPAALSRGKTMRPGE